MGGVYCEDCEIANLATEDSPFYLNVRAWACDADAADRLWQASEKMLASA